MQTMEQIRSGTNINYGQQGKSLYVTRAGDAAIAYELMQKKAKISVMHKENTCCEDLSIKTHELSGDYSIPIFM